MLNTIESFVKIDLVSELEIKRIKSLKGGLFIGLSKKYIIKFSVVDKKIINEIVFLYLDNSILLQTQIIIKGKIKITYFGEITPALKIEY